MVAEHLALMPLIKEMQMNIRGNCCPLDRQDMILQLQQHWSLYLSDYEDGTIQGEAENTGNCSSIESRVSGYIYRKLATPEWDDTKGIICTNSTFNFTVYDVSGANSYYWEPTGGFKVWNGSSYVTTPVSTVSASISVKAPSSNGAGSISVTAKRSSNGVLDSETI